MQNPRIFPGIFNFCPVLCAAHTHIKIYLTFFCLVKYIRTFKENKNMKFDNTITKLFAKTRTYNGNMMIRNGDNHDTIYTDIVNPYTSDAQAGRTPGDDAGRMETINGDLDMRGLRLFINNHFRNVTGSVHANGSNHVHLRALNQIGSDLNISDSKRFSADQLTTVNGSVWANQSRDASLDNLKKIGANLILRDQSIVFAPELKSVDGTIFATNVEELNLPSLASAAVIYAVNVNHIKLPAWTNGTIYIGRQNIPTTINVNPGIKIVYGDYQLTPDMIRSAIDAQERHQRTSANLNRGNNNCIPANLSRAFTRLCAMIESQKKR